MEILQSIEFCYMAAFLILFKLICNQLNSNASKLSEPRAHFRKYSYDQVRETGML